MQNRSLLSTFSSIRAKVSLVIGLVFSVVFGVVGAFACYWGYQLYYVKGAPWQQAAMFAGAGAAFVLGSLFGVVGAFRRRAQRADRERLREKHADAPWNVRPAWRDGRIETAEQDSTYGSLFFFALLWNAFSWPFAYFVFFKGAGEGDAWIVLLFPAIGVGMLLFVAYQFVRRRKFGNTVLELETLPGILGERLTGRVKTGVKAEAASEEGFHVALSCYRRRVRYRRDSDGDRHKEVDLDLLWRDEKRLRGRPYTAGDGAQKLEVPVSFALPQGEAPSTPFKRENRILWRLDLDADLPGIDYGVELEVPVFAGEERDTPASTASPGSETAAEEEPADVFWNTDGEGTALQREKPEPAPEKADVEESDPYADYEVGGVFDAPVSGGIEVRPSAGGGTEFFFDKARDRTSLVVTGVVALAMAGGAVLFFANGVVLAGLCLGFFAVVFGYVAYRQATRTTTLTVEGGQVAVRSGSFGGGTAESFPAGELDRVAVEVGGQAGGKARYALKLVRASGTQASAQTTQAADRAASFAEKFASVSAGEASAEKASDQVRQQVIEAAGAQARTVDVAGGLTNKQEADWLAEQIEEAARREARYG